MVSPSPSPSLPPQPPPPPLKLRKLRALRVLGKGAMGTVFLVHDVVSDPLAKSLFALKVVDKTAINSKFDGDRRARWEIRVLKQISVGPNYHHHHHPNPFLPRLIATLETHDFLAWAVPYCPGGDLNVLRHRQIDGVFSCAVIRFYLAEIICALEHLHSMGIVYRDLKPENILVQTSGHVVLTDFDLSRSLRKKTHIRPEPAIPNPNLSPSPTRGHRRSLTRWLSIVPADGKVAGLKKAKSARVSPVSRRVPNFTPGERSNSFVGTEEYVSPEVVRGDGHEFAVDWWALGVLAFEMMYGTTPFKGKNRKETFRNVLYKQPEFVGNRTDLVCLIERLLRKDPTQRLGYYGGACEIKRHAFFNGVKWDLLTEVSRPPFIPSRDDGVVGAGGIDIKEYFKKLKSPQSPSSDACRRNDSFEEY